MANEANIKAVITADDRASATLRKFSSNVEATSQKGEASFLRMGAAIGAVAGIVSNVANRAINVLSDSLGTAINRVDTLDNANRTFQNMGFKAKETADNMDLLKKSILGLPTSLDSAVRNVELLASSTNDLGKSRKIFSALNDGILGFGGTADQVNTAVIQLSQAFAGGRVMAQDWNSMLNAGLGPALNAIAKTMGKTTHQLKEGLSDGSISVQKFQDALINLDEKGGAGMASLQKIVKDSTKGIGTGIANAKTAIARGIADILKAIGTENISNAISVIGSSFEKALSHIGGSVTEIIAKLKSWIPAIKEAADKVADYLAPKFAAAFKTWKEEYMPAVADLIKALGPTVGVGLVWVLGAAADAFNAALKVITPVLNWLKDNTYIVWLAVAAFAAFKTVLFIDNTIAAFQRGMAILMGETALGGATTAAAGATTQVGLLRGALLGVAAPWEIGIALVGAGIVMAEIKQIKDGLDDLTKKYNDSKKVPVKAPGGVSVPSNSGLGIISGFQNAFRGRASGGPVTGKTPYIVGEKGPELFVPSKSGSIVPNDKMPSGGTINISVNAGVFMGSDVEARKAAETILMHMKQLAGSKNMTLQDYIA